MKIGFRFYNYLATKSNMAPLKYEWCSTVCLQFCIFCQLISVIYVYKREHSEAVSGLELEGIWSCEQYGAEGGTYMKLWTLWICANSGAVRSLEL